MATSSTASSSSPAAVFAAVSSSASGSGSTAVGTSFSEFSSVEKVSIIVATEIAEPLAVAVTPDQRDSVFFSLWGRVWKNSDSESAIQVFMPESCMVMCLQHISRIGKLSVTETMLKYPGKIICFAHRSSHYLQEASATFYKVTHRPIELLVLKEGPSSSSSSSSPGA